MYHETATYQAILNQLRRYPEMQIGDLLKFMHQSTFGCGHLINSPAAASAYLKQEMQTCPPLLYVPIEELDGEYSSGWYTLANTASARIYLKQLNTQCETLLEKKVEPMSVLSYLGKSLTASCFVMFQP